MTTSTRTRVRPPGRAARAGRRRRPGPTLEVDLGHQRRHEGHLRLAAVGQQDDEPVLGGAELEPAHLAEHGAGGVDDGQPPQLLLGEDVVLVVGGQHVGGVDDEPGAAQRLGAGAVGDLLERHEPDPVVHPGRAHGQRPRHPGAGGGLGVDDRADGQAPLGLVGVQLHGHLTVQAVRLADPGDHGALAHGFILSRVRVGRRRRGVPGSLLPAHPAVGAGRVSGPGRCRRCRCGSGDRRRAHPSRCAARWRCGRSDR